MRADVLSDEGAEQFWEGGDGGGEGERRALGRKGEMDTH